MAQYRHRRPRPVSQQLAPDEQVLAVTCIPRDELTRRSTRHEPLPHTVHTPAHGPRVLEGPRRSAPPQHARPPSVIAQQLAPNESPVLFVPTRGRQNLGHQHDDDNDPDELVLFPPPEQFYTCSRGSPDRRLDAIVRDQDHPQCLTNPEESHATPAAADPEDEVSRIPNFVVVTDPDSSDKKAAAATDTDSTMGKKPGDMAPSQSPAVSEKNGELPYDQLIPLEELPRDQHPYGRYTPRPPGPVFDSQPLLRRPKRRRTQNYTGSNGQYNSRVARCIGALLIVIGLLEIALNILGILFQHFDRTKSAWNIVYFLGPGLWSSIFFILCGTFGIVSARSQVTWSIVTHLVTATLASVFGFLLLAMCGWGIYREIQLGEQLGIHLPCLIIMCLMAFGAVLAIPLAVWASVICCNLFCHKWRT